MYRQLTFALYIRKKGRKEKMIKNNSKFKMKQSDGLHPIVEFVIGGGITFISALFCMWLCQFSCGVSLTEINAKSAFILNYSRDSI